MKGRGFCPVLVFFLNLSNGMHLCQILQAVVFFPGNPEVWHGNVTTLIKDEVVVESLEDDQECSDGKAQMKNRSCSDLSKCAVGCRDNCVFIPSEKKTPRKIKFSYPLYRDCKKLSDDNVT